jgi:hypothetical protein
MATHKHGMAVSEINVELDIVTLDADVRSATATFFKEVIQAVAEAGISTIKTYTGPFHGIRTPCGSRMISPKARPGCQCPPSFRKFSPQLSNTTYLLILKPSSGISVMTITPLTASSGCLWHISRISAAISKQTMNSTALLFGRRG